ncbi:type II toxin-antitoxin system Phd/YefM family antitoxin [Candidatus Parcubacteria bacterium]|nr:MAG: type II toxin-antitoxin system Phd/YefM family antitoxin [Candidatus Parcubacteria bacterium]
MKVTVTELRANIFRLIDRVIKTGVPLEIERNGKRLRIVPVDGPSKLDSLKRKDGYLNCAPEDIVHMDWSEQWRP